jgi:hypothetical protein
MIVFRKTACSSSTNGTRYVVLAPDDEDTWADITASPLHGSVE